MTAAKTVDRWSAVFAFELPIATPSLNELMAWKYRPELRRWKYKQHQESLRKTLTAILEGSPLVQSGEPAKVRVTVTRYSSGTLDDANLRGGCKPLFDVLVDLGVLHDDSPKWLEDHYRQEPAARNEKRTRLEIEFL